jgi:autophagy-related protein 27
VKQQAVIEFVCNRDVEGTEGEWTPEDEYDPNGDKSEGRRSMLGRREDDDDDDKHEHEGKKEKQLIKEGAALKFLSYGHEQWKDPKFDGEVLRLEWTTKHVCTKKRGEEGDGDPSSHWGFFTWLVIM